MSCMKKIEEYISKLIKNPYFFIPAIVFVGSLIAAYDCSYLTHGTDKIDDGEDISNWLYFITALATVLLAVIAYNNFKHFNDINKHKYLLQIDKRWSDPEIIKARQIIHVIYRAVSKINKDRNDTKDQRLVKDIYPYLSEIIIKLSDSEKIVDQKAFIYLLNYLDFMESIAYLYKDESNDKIMNELNAFCGDTLMFNYGMFYRYIDSKKDKNRTNKKFNRYNNFRELMNHFKTEEDFKIHLEGIEELKQPTIKRKILESIRKDLSKIVN